MITRRGLRGVKLVISDAHEGIKAAVTKVLNANWQRCCVHFMRNVLAHAGRHSRRVVSAFIATAVAQDEAEAARVQDHYVEEWGFDWHTTPGAIDWLTKVAAEMASTPTQRRSVH